MLWLSCLRYNSIIIQSVHTHSLARIAIMLFNIGMLYARLCVCHFFFFDLVCCFVSVLHSRWSLCYRWPFSSFAVGAPCITHFVDWRKHETYSLSILNRRAVSNSAIYERMYWSEQESDFVQDATIRCGAADTKPIGKWTEMVQR